MNALVFWTFGSLCDPGHSYPFPSLQKGLDLSGVLARRVGHEPHVPASDIPLVIAVLIWRMRK